MSPRGEQRRLYEHSEESSTALEFTLNLRRAWIPVDIPKAYGVVTAVYSDVNPTIQGGSSLLYMEPRSGRRSLRSAPPNAYLNRSELERLDQEELEEYGEILEDDGSFDHHSSLEPHQLKLPSKAVYLSSESTTLPDPWKAGIVWCEDGTLWSNHVALGWRLYPSVIVMDTGRAFVVHGHDAADDATSLDIESISHVSHRLLQYVLELEGGDRMSALANPRLSFRCSLDVKAKNVMRNMDGVPFPQPPADVLSWYKYHYSIDPPGIGLSWNPQAFWEPNGWTASLAVPEGTEISSQVSITDVPSDGQREVHYAGEIIKPAERDGTLGIIKVRRLR